MLEASIDKKLGSLDLHCQLVLGAEILVLWGASGAGKSTVLHCLAGLLQPDSGYIRINQRVVFDREKKINLPARQRRIGYLFQDYNLFPHMTVRKNILYGYKNLPSAVRQSHPNPLDFLAMFGIEHLLNRYPNQLSGGEKQRVAMARALSACPEVLLLDEPFSALDWDNKVKLKCGIKNLQRQWQIPFIVVTHDRQDALDFGDQIIKITQGQASPQQVMNVQYF